MSLWFRLSSLLRWKTIAMDHDRHALGLGQILGNFHALEFSLRVFLCEANGEQFNFPTIQVSRLPKTHLTNYDSLGKLIDAYNGLLTPRESAYATDPAIVKIRDAIAHGRLMSTSMTFPVTLYKFGKEQAGEVPLEFAEVLSETWFENNRRFIFAQISRVLECAKGRGYRSFG